jgi:hypothetical protein
MPLPQPLVDEVVASLQVDKPCLPVDAKLIAITLLQRRTRQHHALALRSPAFRGVAQRLEPGRAVGIVQRNSMPDFLDICRRVEAVSVHEFPAEPASQQDADGRLSRAGYAHHHHDHRTVPGKPTGEFMLRSFITDWEIWDREIWDGYTAGIAPSSIVILSGARRFACETFRGVEEPAPSEVEGTPMNRSVRGQVGGPRLALTAPARLEPRSG